jgi:N-methylhydantoinase B
VLEEGLRLSHVKLFEAGKPGRQVFKIIEKNVRFPEITIGDLNAEIAAVRTGSKRLAEMIEKFGVEVVLEAFVLLMEISERRTRESLASIPSGSYEFEDYIDSDGLTPDPRKIAVKIAIGDGNITIDFTGTDEQGLGSINSSLTATQSAVYYAVRCLTDPDIMQNEGCTRPIIVVAPEGTLVNPRPPAACAGRSNIAHRIVDVIFGALSDAIPEKIETASYGTSPCYTIFGSVGGTRRLYMDCNHGSSGARLGLDGNDGCTSKTSNPQNLTIEATEAYLPIRFARYEFVTDSGGPGEARGGMAIDRAVEILFDNAQVEVRADRQTFPPYGLQGGAAGKETKVTVVRESGQTESLPSCSRASLEFGDEYSLVCASAGGFGDPKRRPVELVVRDVEDGKVSIQGAAHDYGVVLRPDLSVDWEATNGLRVGVEEVLR